MHSKTETLITSLIGRMGPAVTAQNELPFYRKILAEEFVRRCQKNPRYSLRAYALSLEVGVPHLSRILRGQRRLSHGKAQSLIERLQLSQDLISEFLVSVTK